MCTQLITCTPPVRIVVRCRVFKNSQQFVPGLRKIGVDIERDPVGKIMPGTYGKLKAPVRHFSRIFLWQT